MLTPQLAYCYAQHMRLRDVLERIKHALPLLRFEKEQIPGALNQVRIESMKSLREGVVELREVPLLSKLAGVIMQDPLFLVADGAVIDVDHYNKYNGMLNQLRTDARQLHAQIAQAVTESDPESVYIKLPALNSLSELQNFIHRIEIVFDVPARRGCSFRRLRHRVQLADSGGGRR